ncbi:hypothetical protein OF001_U190051 [Pseudomonas sp. OF001]|nr:hypothetical protein OF001_U190051 [Pseudomonas sp. OF001]
MTQCLFNFGYIAWYIYGQAAGLCFYHPNCFSEFKEAQNLNIFKFL